MGDSKEGLNFPDLAPVDHARHCPTYTNIINRRGDEMVQMDEMDSLQMDLETLLVAATRRMRQLTSEIQMLSDGQEGKRDKKKEQELKRSKPSDERPTKKIKSDSPAHPKYFPGSSSSSSTGRSKAKTAMPKALEYDMLDDTQPQQTSRIPVNDAPNRFWQSIEPYCTPVTTDNVRLLEKLCQTQLQPDDEYYKIPELGVHFSQRWALEDMREEKSEGSRAIGKTFEKQDGNVEGILKKAADTLESSDPCPFGSLTQRLISAFVEENMMVPPDQAASMLESGKHGSSGNTVTGGTDKMSNSIKITKSLSHTHKLESRIRMELIEQGILEPETTDSKKEDEVLKELVRSQQELKAVSSRNRDVLQQLLQVAQEELKKQEVKRKIDSLNTEVMEHYRRVMAARQKKRTLMKKEKEAAWKALRDRDALIKQLE
uniref:Transcriptional adapter 3-like n=1 Tax=Phallusia mammillata TaxID=59560 RepID=A0A6F9DV83_9ASCI|nr:transcriptional adapter 3-like [Phallusia mammillata]